MNRAWIFAALVAITAVAFAASGENYRAVPATIYRGEIKVVFHEAPPPGQISTDIWNTSVWFLKAQHLPVLRVEVLPLSQDTTYQWLNHKLPVCHGRLMCFDAFRVAFSDEFETLECECSPAVRTCTCERSLYAIEMARHTRNWFSEME